MKAIFSKTSPYQAQKVWEVLSLLSRFSYGGVYPQQGADGISRFASQEAGLKKLDPAAAWSWISGSTTVAIFLDGQTCKMCQNRKE